jgi:hypothetical protein
MSAIELDKKRPNEQPRRAINAGLAGALFGAVGGAIIGTAIANSPWLSSLLSAVMIGLGEAVTDYRRQPAQLKPLAWRIFVSIFLGAVLGCIFYLLWPETSLLLAGLLIGLVVGFFGLHWQNILLGGALGLVLTLLYQASIDRGRLIARG